MHSKSKRCLLLALLPSTLALTSVVGTSIDRCPSHSNTLVLQSAVTADESVADLSTKSSSNIENIMSGRIEQAFVDAKARGEAAFITFVTAGYPSAKGGFHIEL
jgi:hypothetical protein